MSRQKQNRNLLENMPSEGRIAHSVVTLRRRRVTLMESSIGKWKLSTTEMLRNNTEN